MTRTLTTSKGEVVTTTLADREALNVLERWVELGGASSFAVSLVAQAKRRPLSVNQWPWVHKLALERTQPAQEAPQGPALIGGLQAVTAMLQTAAHKLKWPRITYRGLRLSLSKQPDTVNVTSDESAFAARTFYGRITPGGSFQATRFAPASVSEVLADLAIDPVSKTAAEGKRTGACSFCGRELSTAESLHVGYGPVCAEKYGLPWGETPEPTTGETTEPVFVGATKITF